MTLYKVGDIVKVVKPLLKTKYKALRVTNKVCKIVDINPMAIYPYIVKFFDETIYIVCNEPYYFMYRDDEIIKATEEEAFYDCI